MEDRSTSHRPSLDPAVEEMRKIGYEFIDQFVKHMSSLGEQRVARRRKNSDFLDCFGEELPESSSEPAENMRLFFEKIVPGMTRVNHPRFHAFIPCPSSFAGSLGAMMAAATNPFVGSWLGGASIAALELMVLDWIKDALQLGDSYAGIFTSGGSMANLVGLASARTKVGRQVLERGIVYVSEEGHASMNKAALELGLPSEGIRKIATDERYRLDTQRLSAAIKQDRAAGLLPFFVSANAGATNTGAIDDLETIGGICRANDMWFHVDAAYGGFAAMVPSIREKMKGFEIADSVTLDPHKWLYCPMGVGCALVKNRDHLEAAFSTEGSYLKDLNHDEVNFLERGPELSRPARALPVWMVLKTAGREKLVYQIEKDIELAELAAEWIDRSDMFEINSVELSIVTFRNRRLENESEHDRVRREDMLIEALIEDGDLMLSSTTLNGQNMLRFVVMNHRTTESDVRRSIAKIDELAQKIAGRDGAN